ncbi:MAG: protein kinase domain-containing protein, partial [Planctomycetota bacterium]
MQQLDCPDPATLKAFSIGDLRSEELERIASHVVECDQCEATLDSYDDDDDGLLSNVRRLSDVRTRRAPRVPRDLMLIARSALDEGDGDQSRELVIDAGRKIAGALAEGPYRLGKFQLLEELGVGSFGYVFRAHDTELDRIVAIKIQRASSLATEDENLRFLREARSAAQLEHAHIVSLYETGHTGDGACFLVTEFIEGQTLEDRIG